MPPGIEELKQRMVSFATAHLKESGESYWQHLLFTLSMGGRILLMGTVIVIHGLLPFTFTRTTSRQVRRVYDIFLARNAKLSARNNEYSFDI